MSKDTDDILRRIEKLLTASHKQGDEQLDTLGVSPEMSQTAYEVIKIQNSLIEPLYRLTFLFTEGEFKDTIVSSLMVGYVQRVSNLLRKGDEFILPFLREDQHEEIKRDRDKLMGFLIETTKKYKA
jgi:ABC-type Zn2+ transport system substrate-binding protein/surface adhesin